MFTQILDPTGNMFVTWLVALIPVVVLLFMLAILRWSAWLATLIGSLITLALGLWVWQMPLDQGIQAYVYGSATGVWNVDWITVWGMVLFNTLTVSGVFENFRRWLIAQGSMDVRVQTMLFAWAFGALLEGLVGFGYPWAVVAPILISLGLSDLDAIRVGHNLLQCKVFGRLLNESVLVVKILRSENILRIRLRDEKVSADNLLLCPGYAGGYAGCHPCSSAFLAC